MLLGSLDLRGAKCGEEIGDPKNNDTLYFSTSSIFNHDAAMLENAKKGLKATRKSTDQCMFFSFTRGSELQIILSSSRAFISPSH